MLNKNGKRKGLARVYVDGEIVVENKRSTGRKSKEFQIGGVRAHIGYMILEAPPNRL